FVKPLMIKYHTITIVKWVFLFGLVYVTPFGLQECMEVQWEKFDNTVWFNFIYILILTTFFAYILNTYALKALSPSVVSAYIYLQPFLAAVFGVMWGMDVLTLEKVIYSVIVFVGVYLAGRG
ncbi:MAG: EamA family transporter, partial [Flavobacteriales bacterium]